MWDSLSEKRPRHVKAESRRGRNTILDWETPHIIRDVQCFLGFANFYRRYILRYFAFCQPLFNLLHKGSVFCWTPEYAGALESLKKILKSAPVLKHLDLDLDTVVETDASNYCVSGVLSQKHGAVVHPVAYI